MDLFENEINLQNLVENDFAEIFINLARYRLKNNIVKLLK